MDRPVLHPFVRELADERALPRVPRGAARHPRPRLGAGAAARCSRRCYEELGAPARRALARGRRRARRSPRRPAGSSATSTSRSCPAAASAGAPGSSRRRTSSGSGRGRSTCSRREASSARPPRRLPRGCRRRRRGPAPLRIAPGDEPGIDGLAEHLALAGYERVEQAQERGQFALRGGIVDVYPDDRPRAAPRSSSSATRSRASAPSRPSRSARCIRSTRRRSTRPPSAGSTSSSRASPTKRRAAPPSRTTSCRPIPAGPGLRLAARRSARGLGGGAARARAARGRGRARPATRGPAVRLRGAATRDRRARASPRPRTSSARSFAAGCARVVAFPHQGEALRTQNLLRRVEARLIEPGEELPDEAELLFAVSPARRGFVWRELGLALLPDTQVFRRRTRGRAAPRGPRAPVVRRAPDRRLRRPRGPRRRQAARLRDEGDRRHHARLPSARLPRRGPALRPARADRQGLALHRRRRKRAGALEARRQGVATAQDPRPRGDPRARRRADPALRRSARTRRASPTTSPRTGSSASRASFPYHETPDQRTAIEAVKEDLEAPRPMDRLVCGDVGFGKTEVAVRAAFAAALNGKQTLMLVPTTVLAAAALEHVPRALPGLPGPGRDGLALPQAGGREDGARRVRRRARSTC